MTDVPNKPNIILMGPPGSGKSTLGLALGDYVHISTGDLIREEIAQGTALGAAMQRTVAQGKLISSAVAAQLVTQRLSREDVKARGFILDGFPRTAEQVGALRAARVPVEIVIVLHCARDELVKRMCSRRIDPKTNKLYSLRNLPAGVDASSLVQRPDDEEHVIVERYALYKANEQQILAAFRGSGAIPPHIVHIDADQPPAAIVAACKAQLRYFEEMWATESRRFMPQSKI